MNRSIGMPFWMKTQVGPRNHVLHAWGCRSPKGKGQFWGFPPHWQCIVTRTLQMTSCNSRRDHSVATGVTGVHGDGGLRAVWTESRSRVSQAIQSSGRKALDYCNYKTGKFAIRWNYSAGLVLYVKLFLRSRIRPNVQSQINHKLRAVKPITQWRSIC